jgi:hypothetical protein
MSDLPEERLKSCPPFTYVDVDCFGPWDIVTRRTRGGSVNSKRWAAPMKFVPLSEKNSFTLPRIAIKRRNSLIKDEVLISSMTFM